MKIKNNSSVSIKPLLSVFVISGVIATVLRCIQMWKYIDPETGFSVGGGIFSILLYAVLILSCGYFSVASFLSRDGGKIDVHGIKSPLLGSFALVFAVSLLYDWIYSFSHGVASLGESSYLGGVKSLMTSGSLPLSIQSIFAFFSAVYFFIVALDFLKGSAKSSKFKLLALSPVGWAGLRLIHRFVRQISFVEVSDLLLELIMLAFMIMFFMAFAQTNSGVYSEDFKWRLTGFGLSAGVIALCLSVARLVFTFINSAAYINPEHPFYFADFAFSFFVIVLALEAVKSLQNGEEETGLTQEDELNESEGA